MKGLKPYLFSLFLMPPSVFVPLPPPYSFVIPAWFFLALNQTPLIVYVSLLVNCFSSFPADHSHSIRLQNSPSSPILEIS